MATKISRKLLIGSQGVWEFQLALPKNMFCYIIIKEVKIDDSYCQVLFNKFSFCQCMLIFNVCIVAVTTIVSQDFVLIFIFVHF